MTAVETVQAAAARTAVVRETVPFEDLPAFFDRALAAVAAVLDKQGTHVTGPPVALYHGRSAAGVDVEAGFPVAAEIAVDGAVRPGVLPGGPAVETVHEGPYETLPEAYEQLREWMAERGLRPAQEMWEAYLTEPGSPAHPEGPQTLVVWPVDQPAG